ncbi:MAG: dihydroxyacetone kinase subunit DhaL [Thermoguttaceae bacterium]|jgi:dihydroxyacetone kinase-like protein
MPNLTSANLSKILQSGAARVKENHELLSRLDAATGDGDHGVTMKRVADVIIASIADGQSLGVGPLLEQVGWNVMSVDGGSTSPLLGSFFMGMSDAVGGSETLDSRSLAAAFEAGLAKLRAQTPAQVGDKTMVDALVPAVEALRQAADAGAEPSALLAQAAEAAQRGAERTSELQARFGRARNLGPRTIGHVDPGATSIALFFAGFRDGAQ